MLLARAIWWLFATFCMTLGIVHAFAEGGFFWIVFNFITPIGFFHGFGHLMGVW